MLSFPFVLLSLIDAQHSEADFNNTAQNLCMRRFIAQNLPAESRRNEITDYILNKGPTRRKGKVATLADPCSWNGVECTDGILHTFAVDPWHGEECVVDMDWLPPTVRILSLSRSRIAHNWTIAMLPREMRFLLLWHTYVLLSVDRMAPLDLDKLPQKMEELHLYRTTLRGEIRIERLPDTMRIIDIGGEFVHTALIKFEDLPKNLVSISITRRPTDKPKVKIIRLGGGKADMRVTNKRIGPSRSKSISAYKQMFPYEGPQGM